MTTEVLSLNLVANQQQTLGQGRIWYVKSATAALNITLETLGTGAKVRKFTNIGAGFKFTAEDGDGWTYLRIVSATNQTVEMVVGDDDVEVANAVTVSGGVAISETPSAAVADTVDTAQGSGTQTVIAANPARRRITIGCLSTSTNPVRVSSAGGAGRGIEVSPGTFLEFRTTAALAVRNDNTSGSGGAATWYAEEET